MSRYPGTQFKVFDNSQVTAMVPIATGNQADAVQYLAAFSSVKGPEGITLSYGGNFYDKYGTQDNIDFKKYGQPLLQASMNVNNGASILGKRVVLDDATLGNATLAVAVTKYKTAIISVESDNANLIQSISFGDADKTECKYSLAPIVFSIDNATDGYRLAKQEVEEHKERYDIYKNYIEEVVANDDTPDARFLSKLINDTPNAGVLSGFSQSVYYDAAGNIVDINTQGTSSVRTVKNITTGLGIKDKKTYSSVFDYRDITDDTAQHIGADVSNTQAVYNGPATACYTVMAYVPYVGWTKWDALYEDDTTRSFVDVEAVTYKELTQIDISRIVDTYADLAEIHEDSWDTPEYAMAKRPELALVMQKGASKSSQEYKTIALKKWSFVTPADPDDPQTAEEEADETAAVLYGLKKNPSPSASGDDYYITDDSIISGSAAEILDWTSVADEDKLNTLNYDDTTRLVNDLMVSRSGYIVGEWIFPMFTIFDNGRGESIKSISIEYDTASASAMKKAVYKLSVYNYATGKKLESFSFSLNPYTRNNNTGYTFDIESAVNYKSNQILVHTYYESYEALLEVLQAALKTNDDDLIGTYDILFGHTVNGKYKAFSTYNASKLLKRVSYVYDYAHLDIFDNDVVTVNAYCDEDNMTDQDETSLVKYYYYNWVRTNSKLLERLEYGSDGYVLTRVATLGAPVVPFVVLDDLDTTIKDVTYNGQLCETMSDLVEITGWKTGTIISSATGTLVDGGVVDANFTEVVLAMTEIGGNLNVIADSNYSDAAIMALTIDAGSIPDAGFAYKLTYNATTGWTFVRCQVMPGQKIRNMTNVFFADDAKYAGAADVTKYLKEALIYTKHNPAEFAIVVGAPADTYKLVAVKVNIPYSAEKIYQNQYKRFFSGEFDKDIFNLDVYFPNAIFDANFDKDVKLAIQRLVAYRGDLMAYMDMGIGNVKSYDGVAELIPSMESGLDLSADSQYAYVRDMHIAVTCLYYKTRNPYNNKVIDVTGTYGLSNLYVRHFANGAGNVFAGISNGITLNEIIRGSVNYIPKIYPTSEMTSLTNIGGVYPSDDATIINEKQMMCDLKVNYGCYYDDRFSIETEYTLNPSESEFSYFNNVALVCAMMQAIRKACPAARYQFITADDLGIYREAVENAMKPWKNKFAYLNFKYVQDDTALENKIFYAAIEVAFKPFAQAEIFELTALNYSTLSNNVTTI